MSSNIPVVPMFIGGEYCQSSSGVTYDVYNPATGKVIEHTAAATAQDCVKAVEAADNAFELWQYSTPVTRASIFQKAAALVTSEKYISKVTQSVVDETGCPAAWAKFVNCGITPGFLTEACDMPYQVKGEILPSNVGAISLVQKYPLGVVLVISPWNAPLGLVLMTAIPPIAAGCAVVLKTSEHSPASQLIAAELLKEAGLPDGVLNIIHTSREDSGPRVAEIIAHPLVRKIAFTGSDRVGRILAFEAAKHLKPCVFELGGKAPAVVSFQWSVI
ncbi:hypothetical protein NM688_g8673 [Phlebia brevispora]|uniref:Uncharacterized protein n=1 Tax=Phlebia brevispora TaxID=194682 RepID=A0ACC1RPF8_9APHY|nr:hypothetical protein NM688_g8673 [Phlebia brevispora]